jgi:hypothetical protein
MNSENERPVSLRELKAWSAILEEIARDLLNLMDPEKTANPADLWPHTTRNARFMADFLRDKIEPYINEGISVQRLTEDAAILNEQMKLMRLRRPDWEKEQYLALKERSEGTGEKKK